MHKAIVVSLAGAAKVLSGRDGQDRRDNEQQEACAFAGEEEEEKWDGDAGQGCELAAAGI